MHRPVAALAVTFEEIQMSNTAAAPSAVRAVARGRTGTNFVTRITAGAHALVADEPIADGGTDAGPKPFELLASALVACTAMTVRMYANRKQFPLDSIDVEVTVLKADVDAGRPRDRFVRTVTLGGALTDEQRQKCLEIAKKCPVGRTLEAGADIDTTLA